MKCINHFILIRPEKDEMTEGGIILNSKPGHAVFGTVVSCGEGQVAEGDRVLFMRGGVRHEMTVEGELCQWVHEDDIITVIEHGDHVSLS